MLKILDNETAGMGPKASPLWKVYGDLNRFAWENPLPSVTSGAGKIYFRAMAVIKPWKLFGFHRYSGYGNHKLKSMLNTYLSDERIDLVRRRISRRQKGGAGRISRYCSIGVPLGTGAKDKEEKTGECITGISFNLIPKRESETGEPAVNVSVFFRVSEVTRRLLGDFLFLDYVFNRVLGPIGLLDKLNTVTFYFGTFYTVLYHYVIWERMFPEARKLIPNPDAFKKSRWDSALYEGTTGNSVATRKPLTHSPKIVAARIYKDLKGAPGIFVSDKDGVSIRKEARRYDGPQL